MKAKTMVNRTIKMEEVESSMISAIGYDAGSKKLRVRFANGNEYLYCGVSKHVHKKLMNAESIGKYFNKTIRSNADKYNYRRLSD